MHVRWDELAKEKISVTVDARVLAHADADAKAAGLNRSELMSGHCATSTYVARCTPTPPGPRRRSTSTPTLNRSTTPTRPRPVIRPGDITPRQDTSRELYVAVLSNSIHLAANTGG